MYWNSPENCLHSKQCYQFIDQCLFYLLLSFNWLHRTRTFKIQSLIGISPTIHLLNFDRKSESVILHLISLRDGTKTFKAPSLWRCSCFVICNPIGQCYCYVEHHWLMPRTPYHGQCWPLFQPRYHTSPLSVRDCIGTRLDDGVTRLMVPHHSVKGNNHLGRILGTRSWWPT